MKNPNRFVGDRVMITRIREVRRAKGMTLDDVARKCSPATTPQTIGADAPSAWIVGGANPCSIP